MPGLKYLDGPCSQSETGQEIGSMCSQSSSHFLGVEHSQTCLDIALLFDSAMDFPQIPNEVVAVTNSARS